MKKIAVLTSGGDSPGMNACIRAVVRSALYSKVEIYAVFRGYEGLIDNDFKRLDLTDVTNIIQRGGTILKSSRSSRFRTREGRGEAHKNLLANNIEGLIVIGGDGTFTGASIFYNETRFSILGIPGTIDNDLFGTDSTIGYDSALNTIVQALDKIRDTATSHERLFIVEVMGKDAGFIALRSGIAVGAKAILVPETPTYIPSLLEKLKQYSDNKSSNIIIVSEGDDYGGAFKVAKAVKERYNKFDIKVTILGHIQRGGNPSAYDRVLASRLGVGAVNALLEGRSNEMLGIIDNKLEFTSFSKTIKHNRSLNSSLLELSNVLSL